MNESIGRITYQLRAMIRDLTVTKMRLELLQLDALTRDMFSGFGFGTFLTDLTLPSAALK